MKTSRNNSASEKSKLCGWTPPSLIVNRRNMFSLKESISFDWKIILLLPSISPWHVNNISSDYNEGKPERLNPSENPTKHIFDLCFRIKMFSLTNYRQFINLLLCFGVWNFPNKRSSKRIFFLIINSSLWLIVSLHQEGSYNLI